MKRGGVALYTDWLWFREMPFTSVFLTVLRTQVLLAAVTGARLLPAPAIHGTLDTDSLQAAAVMPRVSVTIPE